ncbi:hypothetical protein GJU39_01695 [Pedobacter petrophilus]|uniref:peptide-methionine (S)-S-oxide reductase n=1 Tax=Pedobacter petrophilus TaxID=1908241 RepID=A0A7K0FT43_9SPHI|nr:peptide-methionine (S)-S-oxide reductase [Pedobacter petrophilus]MRX74788.1 hypothetical protein [Pedobacter petrophilus]
MIKGVELVTSVYMDGELRHPTHMEISNGDTGRAEVVEIIFNKNEVLYTELLLIFFKAHNPTILTDR